jgi:ATP-dependent DNA helicase RecQ
MIDSDRDVPKAVGFAPRCVSLDLEVNKGDLRIREFAAVRGDSGQAFVYKGGDLAAALAELDEFANGAAFILGHNLVDFDAGHLAAANPNLRLLKLPMVDTLRLNPLAFPRNPYHYLVKHYQDGRLNSGKHNDPEADARLALDLFREQQRTFQVVHATTPELTLAWHWLTTADNTVSGLNSFFTAVRRVSRPSDGEARLAIEHCLTDHACVIQSREILARAETQGWPMAYTLAWMSVAGGNSVMPPWVCHRFPEAGRMVRRLRDTPCDDAACAWCRERHDARKELVRWFPPITDFRPVPKGEDGRSLQQGIVEAAMRGEHVLGVLPTGSGKSLCYQIPALSRYNKTGALTVVISPLVALMADQVAGLEGRGILSCAAVNGLLSMPERKDVLDRVRLGDVGILIVSPEQLRNRTLRKVLEQREIGAWVLDEAHCISKWGHDFRPDYRYVGRFIKEKARDGAVAPVLCLTATAKPDVMIDIIGHFRDKLGIELKVFDGGANRANLDFAVVPTTPSLKLAHIHQILMTDLPPDADGGAIVYCASRKGAEEVAEFLRANQIDAEHFHAKLPPETKKNVQDRFIKGKLRVIAATNAFGMGIDKPDVRLVIHADIPGSLENYLQEAGRAGRDQRVARCVLLYTPEDVERQFGMSARSRLTQREIQAILKSLRNLDRRKRMNGTVVATTGEILDEETEGIFERDSATDDTHVRTAIAWLEEATLLSREENQVQVFPSSLRIRSVDEAREKLEKRPMLDVYRRQLLSLVEALITADADEGISTDELMGVSGLSTENVRKALYDLESLGIASNDTALTAFVHTGVERSSQNRLKEAVALEIALLAEMRQAAPDLAKDQGSLLQLRHATQRLKDGGHPYASPEKLLRIVRSLSSDSRNEDSGVGSLRLRQLDAESVHVTIQREWKLLEKTAWLRRAAAERLLEHLLACLPPGTRGADRLAETTLGKLLAAVEGDIELKNEMKSLSRLTDRALLWLHEQDIVRLNKGLAVFRPAMTIQLAQDKRGFVKSDFAPLQLHYQEQVVQIHVMAEYVQRGLEAMADALRLAMDYFSLPRDEFLRRWLPGKEKDLERQTTPASWRAVVECLNNPVQQRLVADDREHTNVLVLAGPGSGKTRVLVHRIAYLVRVRRENPRGIVALAYNRHAAVEIRRRLAALIGDDARGVTVLTCHALAMRLAGVSFRERANRLQEDFFENVLRQAVALLNGDGLPPEEADEQRDRLLAGFRWMLVDEYQDIGSDQYELISALAGRTLKDDDGKLSLFAVGDDDQNIYAFAGASVEFIRRFEADYKARPEYLIENYRSTAHIIDAANRMVAPAGERMKAQHPITINRVRAKASAGGDWTNIDPVAKGRVQILPAGEDMLTQAMIVMAELLRMATLMPNWSWTDTAIIAREWKYLEPLRSFCEINQIPVQMADEEAPHFWRLRETQQLVEWLRSRNNALVDTVVIENWLKDQSSGSWWDLLREALAAYALESNGAELPAAHFSEWLAEWGREIRRRQTGLMLLTAHKAKGLEFDHVVVLDGGWERTDKNSDADATRRLYYVAMTRARKTLTLARFDKSHSLLDALPDGTGILHRSLAILPKPSIELANRYQRLTLGDVDIGYSGRHASTNAVHGAIASLVVGDTLGLRRKREHWEILNDMGVVVGRLAKSFELPKDMKCIAAHVAAVIVRYKDDDQSEFQNLTRCDRWEVIVPDLVFAPDTPALAH